MTEDEAVLAIQSEGLVVGTITYVSGTSVDADYVLSQSILSGTMVGQGQAVSLTVI